jgi:hypothetical protein
VDCVGREFSIYSRVQPVRPLEAAWIFVPPTAPRPAYSKIHEGFETVSPQRTVPDPDNLPTIISGVFPPCAKAKH